MTNVHCRRSFLRGATALGAGLWSGVELDAYPQNVNTNSKPSDLKITDMRVAVLRGVPMTSPIVRIDTNQGIYGLGEVRDGATKNYALELKSRILNENPCNVDKIFRKIKQFGGHARQGGGVSAVEVAMWDLAGKAFGVPVYQMLGGKFRDRIRIYCDTTESPDPKVLGERLKERVASGFTWLKMDLNVVRPPGEATAPAGIQQQYGGLPMEHPFMATEITEKGLEGVCSFVSQIREVLGMTIPLSADHFGSISVNSCIRLGKALTKYNISWLEDMIPWQETDLLKKIADAVDIPILTGEDIFLKEPFQVLCREHAVDIIHPDLLTTGGMLETKKIGDMAQDYGVPMAMHCAHTPIGAIACAHVAAATENFLVLENHAVDVPYWSDLVDGVDKPIVNKGYITVSDKPGLGITLNEAACKQHMAEPGWFEPTDQWNNIGRPNDRLWS
ncbi:MAG: mandelate racemase/muconate lactonizing enzyme family protein [Bryobacteraceae bacterium]